MKIPIANIYYLLIYAWDVLDAAEIRDITAEDQHELVDLLAQVLIKGTSDLLRRGIDRGYVSHEETIPGIRGKLLVAETLQRHLLQTARAHCAFDEFSADVLHNQILKATFRMLLANEELDRHHREAAHDLCRRLGQISDIRLSVHHFRRIQLHRNNAVYDLLLKVCRFLFDNLLVDEQSGHSRFRDFERDEQQMRKLFEAFAYHFFRRHFPQFNVSAPTIDWYGVSREDPATATLPLMKTDIVISSHTRTLIVDTKFTPVAFHSWRDVERARSGHLYQIFAYVKNYALGHPERQVGGILLYPAVDQSFAEKYDLHEHAIEIRSIDLSQPWRTIETDMRMLLSNLAPELTAARDFPLIAASPSSSERM